MVLPKAQIPCPRLEKFYQRGQAYELERGLDVIPVPDYHVSYRSCNTDIPDDHAKDVVSPEAWNSVCLEERFLNHELVIKNHGLIVGHIFLGR
jgi:hypothetical protein